MIESVGGGEISFPCKRDGGGFIRAADPSIRIGQKNSLEFYVESGFDLGVMARVPRRGCLRNVARSDHKLRKVPAQSSDLWRSRKSLTVAADRSSAKGAAAIRGEGEGGHNTRRRCSQFRVIS